jgi:hypothetical protein
MRNGTQRFRLLPSETKDGPVSHSPPDMVRELQHAAFVNQNLQERFQVLTSKLYCAIADADWDGADQVKIKLNAISEILTDV